MTIVLVILVAFAALVGVVIVVGALTPRRHVATVRLRLSQPLSEVWKVIVDLSAWPSWYVGVSRVARLQDVNGHPAWSVADARGRAIPYEIADANAPVEGAPGRLVTRIVDEGLPFGGTWTWTVEQADGGIAVTIVEDGVIKNVIFRALARAAYGYTTTQKRALSSLASRFGETASMSESWGHVE